MGVGLTTAKSVSHFVCAASPITYVANTCIFVVWYDVCLLPA